MQMGVSRSHNRTWWCDARGRRPRALAAAAAAMQRARSEDAPPGNGSVARSVGRHSTENAAPAAAAAVAAVSASRRVSDTHVLPAEYRRVGLSPWTLRYVLDGEYLRPLNEEYRAVRAATLRGALILTTPLMAVRDASQRHAMFSLYRIVHWRRATHAVAGLHRVRVARGAAARARSSPGCGGLCVITLGALARLSCARRPQGFAVLLGSFDFGPRFDAGAPMFAATWGVRLGVILPACGATLALALGREGGRLARLYTSGAAPLACMLVMSAGVIADAFLGVPRCVRGSCVHDVLLDCATVCALSACTLLCSPLCAIISLFPFRVFWFRIYVYVCVYVFVFLCNIVFACVCLCLCV